MNHFQQILEDPNILRTTSSCTDNYSGDSFDMYNFQISLLGGQGGPLTYCQFTFKKNKAIITEPNLPPNLPVVVPPAFMCLVSLDDTHGTTPSEVHLKSIGVWRKKRVFCFSWKNLREAWKRLHSPQQKNVKISRQF